MITHSFYLHSNGKKTKRYYNSSRQFKPGDRVVVLVHARSFHRNKPWGQMIGIIRSIVEPAPELMYIVDVKYGGTKAVMRLGCTTAEIDHA